MNEQTKRETGDFRSKGRALSFVIAEAEYMLDQEKFREHFRPVWMTENPARYGIQKIDYFSLKNIREHCIWAFLGCVLWLGFIFVLLWAGPASYFLSSSAYYVGIGISSLLSAVLIVIRKPLPLFFLRILSNKHSRDTMSVYIEMAQKGTIIILPLALELILGIGFAGFFFYFLFFYYFYRFVVMTIYLVMRIQKGHRGPIIS